MEVALIVNPYASQVTQERVRAVEAELARAGSVTTVLTERQGHATELATGAAGGLVVFSGDGGFNEVLNSAPPGVALGFLPGGGTNVLSRALGMPATRWPRPGRSPRRWRRGARGRSQWGG